MGRDRMGVLWKDAGPKLLGQEGTWAALVAERGPRPTAGLARAFPQR